jgi:hypothetical protein
MVKMVESLKALGAKKSVFIIFHQFILDKMPSLQDPSASSDKEGEINF